MAGTVEGEKIDVGFSGRRCIHSRNRVLGDPHVFVPNAPGQWIHPEAASVEKIVAIAESCPSGAITYIRKDGGPQEQPPVVNTVRIRENGPLAVHAEIVLGGETSFRATLCRCGVSENKPFCNGSHAGGFCRHRRAGAEGHAGAGRAGRSADRHPDGQRPAQARGQS
jgi:uncharacterized Fe-S cluster protein YjdI/CDGSH-type Zn-finger protein